MIETIGKVSHELRRKIGESLKNIGGGQPLEQVTTPSLEALRKYSQAMRIGATAGASSRADQLLEEAVALDTGFAMAWRRLGVNYGNVGERAKQRHAMQNALRHQDRLTERERYLTLGTYYTRVDIQPQKALSAYNALLDIEPDNYPALNNLGLVYARLKNPQKSNEYYHRAIAADSSSATAWFNLVQGFVASGQSDSATALLRQASNKFPDYSGTPWIAAEIAVSQGRYDTARVIYTGLRTSPEISPEEKGAATANLAQVKLLEGRLREAKELISENSRGAAQAGALNYALASELALVAIAGWFEGDRAGAIRILDTALRRYPYAQLDSVDRPYLDVAYFEAMVGRPDRARATIREYEQLPLEIRGRSDAYLSGRPGNDRTRREQPADGRASAAGRDHSRSLRTLRDWPSWDEPGKRPASPTRPSLPMRDTWCHRWKISSKSTPSIWRSPTSGWAIYMPSAATGRRQRCISRSLSSYGRTPTPSCSPRWRRRSGSWGRWWGRGGIEDQISDFRLKIDPE